MAHIVHGRGSLWLEARHTLLDQYNSDPAGHLRNVAITSGAEVSLQGLRVGLMHFFGLVLDHSKWFDSDKLAQLMADKYDISAATVTYDCSNIVIRAPSSV